ncbi:MAG: alpha/beta fold hydrolase [Pseudomonadota bacterium]
MRWLRRLTLGLAFLLTACASIGPPPDPGPVRVDPTRLVMADGESLALYTWPAEERPRAILLALHGFGDAAHLTFAPAARAWTERGITTYAYDQRGFGQNPSRRDWPGPARLVADLRDAALALRARHPDVPLVVIGHSMGGGVALSAADGLPADGVVLAAPAIAGQAEINPFLRIGAFALRTLLPERRFTGDGVVSLLPTDNIEMLRFVARHPLSFGDPTGRELLGLVLLSDRAAATAPRVTLPTLTLIGARDEVIRPAAISRIQETIGGDARVLSYPDGWHWLFRDLQAPRVWSDVADFALSFED